MTKAQFKENLLKVYYKAFLFIFLITNLLTKFLYNLINGSDNVCKFSNWFCESLIKFKCKRFNFSHLIRITSSKQNEKENP